MGSLGGFDVPIDLPSFSFGIGSTSWYLIFLIIFISTIGGGLLFLFHRMKVYNKKIVVFENIAGQGYHVSFKDRARVLKVGDSGEEIMYLLKKKLYRTAYGKKMGKNLYWFAIGQDGYWYNIVLGDIDAKKGMLDIEPVDRDMRYMHVAIRRNIQDRYKKPKFMEQYGPIVLSGMFIIIISIAIWFLLDKIGDIGTSLANAIKAGESITKVNQQLVSSLNNLYSSSGIVPVK